MSHQITLRLRSIAMETVMTSGFACENIRRYTLAQAKITTKKARQEIRMEYIQCFLIIIRKRVSFFSSFSRSFVSPLISKDLNIQDTILEKLINIRKKIIKYERSIVFLVRKARFSLWKFLFEMKPNSTNSSEINDRKYRGADNERNKSSRMESGE